MRVLGQVVGTFLLIKTLPTWLIERHRRRRMEEWRVMVKRRAIAKLELAICCREVWEPRRPLLQAPRGQVHGEPPHLAGRTEERSPAHRRELFQTSFLRALVLEPDLQKKSPA